MLWIEGNASSGLHVDNKRTETFYSQRLVKMVKAKELDRDVLFLRQIFEEGGSMCSHF